MALFTKRTENIYLNQIGPLPVTIFGLKKNRAGEDRFSVLY